MTHFLINELLFELFHLNTLIRLNRTQKSHGVDSCGRTWWARVSLLSMHEWIIGHWKRRGIISRHELQKLEFVWTFATSAGQPARLSCCLHSNQYYCVNCNYLNHKMSFKLRISLRGSNKSWLLSSQVTCDYFSCDLLAHSCFSANIHIAAFDHHAILLASRKASETRAKLFAVELYIENSLASIQNITFFLHGLFKIYTRQNVRI